MSLIDATSSQIPLFILRNNVLGLELLTLYNDVLGIGLTLLSLSFSVSKNVTVIFGRSLATYVSTVFRLKPILPPLPSVSHNAKSPTSVPVSNKLVCI